MSVITFQCFACNQVLQVGADKAGRKAKCSQCGTVLTIPVLAGAASEPVLPAASLPAASLPAAPAARPAAAPPAAAPMAVSPAALPPAPPPVPASARIDDVKVIDDEPRRRRLYDDDDEPRSRRRRDDDYDVRRPVYSKWDKVRIGFLIAFIGLCVVAGAYAIELMGRLIALISYMSGAIGGANIANIFTRIGLILGFVATIAAIVGHVFWLFVSNRTGALGFAITTLAVCGVYLLFQMVGRLVSAFNPHGVPRVVIMLTDLLGAAYFMMMGFYIRALAQQLDRPYVRNRGMLLVVLSSIMAGYELISGIIAMSVAGVGGIVVLIWILFWLGAIIKIVVLVFAILAVYEGKRMVQRETG